MGRIRLTGATSGYTELRAANAAGNNTIILPTTNGGEVIVSDSSGNVNIDSGTFYVDASNNRVGVGTTSPGASLHVAGAIASAPTGSGLLAGINGNYGQAKLYGTTGGILDFGASGADANARLLVNNSDNALQFYTNNGGSLSERLRIDSSGRVGIGTSSPSELFQCQGNARFDKGGNRWITIDAGTNATYDSRIDASHTLIFRSYTAAGGTPPSMVFDTSGRLGIGTTSPSGKLEVSAGNSEGLRLSSSSYLSSSQGPWIAFNGGPSAGWDLARVQGIRTGSNAEGALVFYTNNGGGAPGTISEKARLDENGRLLVGTSSARGPGDHIGRLQVEGTGYATSTISIFANSNDAFGSYLFLGKSRGTAVGSNTIVQSGDSIGQIRFSGTDGTGAISGAIIESFVDGTPGANDMPGRLVFSVTPDGSASPSEAMRIENNGSMRVSGTLYRSGSCGLRFSGTDLIPQNGSGASVDNAVNLGAGIWRWATVYAGTGTINTSDANLKQDIESLNQAELNAATAIKGLIKKFRFTDAVANKGDDARIHVGVIAQEIEQAFVDEGLDPRRYGMFCEDTLEDGSKRLGIRYGELLAFVIAAL